MTKIKKYAFVVKISVQDTLAYAADFIGRSIFFVIIITFMTFLWRMIYETDIQTEGYDINRIIWYLIIGELIALSSASFYAEVSDDVKSGQIAYTLNKPYHYVFYRFSDYFGRTLVQFIINLVIAVSLGLIYVGPLEGFQLSHLPGAALLILLGFGVDFSISMCLALSAFWVEENMPFRWIYQKLVFTLGGMLLPLEFMPETIHKISKYLPFAFVTYVPAKLTTDFNMSSFIYLGSIQLAYAIGLGLLALWIYRSGVKKLNVNGG